MLFFEEDRLLIKQTASEVKRIETEIRCLASHMMAMEKGQSLILGILRNLVDSVNELKTTEANKLVLDAKKAKVGRPKKNETPIT